MLTLAEIWTAVGIILGFQTTTFLWRINNEVAYARSTGNKDVTWLPPADLLNLSAMVVIVLGVFVVPLTGNLRVRPDRWFGLSLILFVGHCFALAGHYDLYNRKTLRSMRYFPLQEKIATVSALVVAGVYVYVTRHA